MSNILDDICIILQGYSVSKDQMTELVEYYIEHGFSKIAISSYSDCVDEELEKRWPDKVKILLNDKTVHKDVKNPVYLPDCEFSSTYGEFKPPNLKVVLEEQFADSAFFSPHPQMLNLAFHLLTTNRGISLAEHYFPDTKYYLKCRADLKMYDLHLKVVDWAKRFKAVKGKGDHVFEKKILSASNPGGKPWVVDDQWTFGTKKDIRSYFLINIPGRDEDRWLKPETYICGTYVSSKLSDSHWATMPINDSWKKVKERYWLFDSTVATKWYKGILAQENKKNKVIYIDIDETICKTFSDRNYANSVPYTYNIERCNKLYDEGHTIVYWTARGTETGTSWRKTTEEQFEKWGVKYHELKFGKPVYDLFIDDKNINSERFFYDD